MTEILILLVVVFACSYVINRIRKVPNPAKDALKLTSILAGAMLILGLIVYVSIENGRAQLNNVPSNSTGI